MTVALTPRRIPSPSCSLSPPNALPRPPRCLTPYPTQTFFHPTSSSPLSSPAVSPDELDINPFDTLGSSRSLEKRPATPAFQSHHFIDTNENPLVSPSLKSFKLARQSVAIGLRMTPLSPTDSSFPSTSPMIVTSPPSGSPISVITAESYRIPLSPSARKYMAEKENKRVRPEPITIPVSSYRHTPSLGSAIRTARPDLMRGSMRAASPGSGQEIGTKASVPLPRTPCTPSSVGSRTAMPLTARRIGINGSQEQQKKRKSVRIDEVVVEVMLDPLRSEEVPMLKGEPSPGWALFNASSP